MPRWVDLEAKAERKAPMGNRGEAVTAESEKKVTPKAAALGERVNWESTKTPAR